MISGPETKQSYPLPDPYNNYSKADPNPALFIRAPDGSYPYGKPFLEKPEDDRQIEISPRGEPPQLAAPWGAI